MGTAPPVEAKFLDTAFPPSLQQSHHCFLRPGFKVGESKDGDNSPHQHHTSCLELPLELRQAPTLLNICTARRRVSACPGRALAECPMGNAVGTQGSEGGGHRWPPCPASRSHHNLYPSCHGGKRFFLSPGNRDAVDLG